jgi:hypothetical protein
MKAINTFYDNNYFRSRLEAKWAMFFNLSGIKYVYEPEGFTDGTDKYLPDFYLPEMYLRDKSSKGVYIEIKPEVFIESGFTHDKWFDKNLIMFCGTPENFILNYSDYSERGFQLYPPWDNYMSFFKCIECGTTKIEFQEGNYNSCPICQRETDSCSLHFNAILAITNRF